MPVSMLMTSSDVERALRRISHQILERHAGADDLMLVGIKTRGVPLARSLASLIDQFEGVRVPCEDLDVTPFRDDLGTNSGVESPGLNNSVDAKKVILVDDVLYTGRTIRAAMDAISVTGRPDIIELAVLVDRGHREIPIRPDYVGKNVPTSRGQRVSVRVEEIDDDSGVWLEIEGNADVAG